MPLLGRLEKTSASSKEIQISEVLSNFCIATGWMFGKLDGRVGIFPTEYVEQMSRVEARKYARQVRLWIDFL